MKMEAFFFEYDDMATLDILKNKNFYEYLLQSLTDHYVKFIDCENVTWRPEFTEEFFASFWLELMKRAGFNSVPEVTLEDQKRYGRIINSFDSIHRSLFAVCESSIDLRVTTLFSFDSKELGDEEQISYRTAFMLVLLFVSEWVADQKDGCPHIALKEPKARLVHACFNKLFKDIYCGNNEGFKSYIFDVDKEASPLSPLPFASPNRSLKNNFSVSLNDVTSSVKNRVPHEREPESLLDPLSESNAALMKAINLKTKKETELESKFKALQTKLNATAAELEKANNLNADLLKSQNELEELLRQNQVDIEKILGEKQSWVEAYNQLQMDHDACLDRLSTADNENDRLKAENEDLMKVINNYGRNGEEKENLLNEKYSLKDVIQQLQMEYDVCLNRQIGADFENDRLKSENEDLVKVINSYARNEIQIGEEKENLLNENHSLKDAIQQFQMEYDSYKFEVDNLKKSNEALMEEKETLQLKLDGKLFEMENFKKVYANSLEEVQRLQQDFLNSSNIVTKKDEEIKNFLDEKLLLNDAIKNLHMAFDSCNAELANVKYEIQKLAESNEELTKTLILEKKNLETLQHAFDAQTYELEKANKISVDNENNFLQQELNKKNRESENFISVITQKEAEYNELLKRTESLIGMNNKYQNEQDVYKEEMSNAMNENEILKEEIGEIMKRENRLTRDKEELELFNVKREVNNLKGEVDILKKSNEALKKEKETLQQKLDGKLLEMESIKKVYANSLEEIQRLQQDLLNSSNIFTQKDEEIKNLLDEKFHLNDAIKNLHMASDILKKSNETFKEEKETLQQKFDKKMFELKNIKKVYANSLEEIQRLQQDLLNASNIVTQKDEENKNLLNENLSLNDEIEKLQMESDSLNEKFLSVQVLMNDVIMKLKNGDRLFEDVKQSV